MKIKVIVMLVLSLVLFASCNSNTTTAEADSENSELVAEIESLKIENELLKQQATETEATTETTPLPKETTTTSELETTVYTYETTSIQENIDQVWTVLNYVDDFNRETDDQFLFGFFNGNFSNSATTNSPLAVSICAERRILNDTIEDSVRIILYEYESNVVSNYYSSGKRYKIQILEDNDNVISVDGYMGAKTERIRVWDDQDQNCIIDALKNNKKLTFRIDEDDGMDTYMFDVDCTGFKDLFESTDWKV